MLRADLSLDLDGGQGACLSRVLSQGEQLDLPKCPHCGIDKPYLPKLVESATSNHAGQQMRRWIVYACKSCGGAILTASWAHVHNGPVIEQYPSGRRVADEIPPRARDFLTQCHASLHAPAGAVVLAASAVDAMLKVKGLANGSLFDRIDEAAQTHIITPEMAAWAHEVRLDANDQRHADLSAPLPSEADASRVLDFALALAEYLFVLPARVSRGRIKPN